VTTSALPLPVIEGYRVNAVIGEGRVATVYMAEDATRGDKVAIKVLKGSREHDGPGWRGFGVECAVLSSIRHEHVVRVIEHRAGAGMACLVMEYLPAGTLRDRMRAGIDDTQAVSLLRQAASALAAVHRRSIVHRDVKPENFLLRDDGKLVLTDFGVAAQAGDAAASVSKGRLVGTPFYASPEQAQGEPPSSTADVYSLGIVFYEMLCGQRPFAGKTVLEILAQHLVAAVPPLPERFAQHQALVDGMLQKRPESRLADGDAILRQIERMAPLDTLVPV
jgi:serine/threonine protein kinase